MCGSPEKLNLTTASCAILSWRVISETSHEDHSLNSGGFFGLTVSALWIAVEIGSPFTWMPSAGKMVTEVAT